MSLELVREQVFLDQSVGNEQKQVLLEGEIIVPDMKPDMAQLLQTEEKMVIDRVEVSQDRVNVVGRLVLQALYMGNAGDTPQVHVLTHTHGMDDIVNLDGVGKDMWVVAKADIANMEFRLLNDRKVSFRAIVNITVRAERSDAHEMVVHIHHVPENQLLKTPLNLNRTIEHRTERITLRDQQQIPAGKPGAREILMATVHIATREERLAHGRINLSGELLVTTLYRGDTDESLIEFAEHTVPFNGPIDISGAKEDMLADVSLQVSDYTVRVLPNDDGEDRILDIDATLTAQLKVYSAVTVPMLQDAYSTTQQLTLQKTLVRYPRLVCLNRNQTTVKDVVQLPTGTPDMLQVFRIKGQAFLDEVKVVADKVIVEGAINTDILYVAGSDEQPMGRFNALIPYRQIIEAKGATPAMRVVVDVNIDHVAFNLLSGRETEVRFLLTFNTQVVEEEEARIIHNIEVADLDDAALSTLASMTVYVVQPTDTLWSIAKRFNASLDDLLAVNELDGTGRVTTGQKLLVLK